MKRVTDKQIQFLQERLLDWYKLPDLHFDKYDDEIDHAFHTYTGIALTPEPATQGSITALLQRLYLVGNQW